MKIITAAVIKGGTGKTTTTAALAQAAKRDRMKVLAVDLDPQANLTFILNGNQNQSGSVQLLHGEDPLQLIQNTEQGIDLIAASPDLAAERTAPASAMRLQQALEPIKKDYDFIFIDTPPQMGELTFNALQAASGLLVPLETDSNSIQGLYQIVDIARQIQNSNPALSIMGAVLTRYDKRANLNRYLRDTIEKTGQEIGAPLIATIRPGIAIREAQAFQRSLYEYAPKSNPAADYLKLYKKIKKES